MDRRDFVDISNYTARFQAHRYAKAGPMLVAILATDGPGFVNPRHAEDAAHAHGAGLDVWHYHFCRPEVDPSAIGEAAHFWRTVRSYYHPGDRLVLDVEQRHPRGLAALAEYTARVDSKVHTISGVHPAGYTYDSLFREVGRQFQVASGDWWIAKPDGVLLPLLHGRRAIARQVRLDGVGKGPVRFPGVEGYDVDVLARWYARRVARDRARRHKSVA